MNTKPLPIGIDNFEMLITRGYYFVDKTLLIKDLLDNKASVNLFTRPRRFGKTLNMSMLQYFFEDEHDESNGTKKDNKYLFDGLNIMDEGEKYTLHMGQYPVINLSLKSAKQPTLDLAFQCLREEISREFKRHEFILNDERLHSQREKFLRILNESSDMSLYITSLRFLSKCLEKYYNKKVIILIDEYDVPLENSFFRGFYVEMIDFIRSLFESSLKTNPSLEFAVITGCLRISKESIFTGLNNLKIISILNTRYDEYFGFTSEEVKKICKYYNMDSKYATIKEWYNGYIFGNANVYNPWSVIQYVDDLKANINEYPSSYWANTSSNSIVKSLIERADDETKTEIELLIEGKSIEKPVHEDITYDEIYKSMDNLYNFMLFTGYFKKVSERVDENTKQKYIGLKIPNEEVKYIFRTKVLSWFDENIKTRDFTKMYNAIIESKPEIFEEELSDVLLESISFNDAYENFYHGFVTGILSSMKGYTVKSNRESGNGRGDIFIRPVSRRKAAIILELKVCKNFNELEQRADEALNQIEEKKYEMELKDDGYNNIIKYGISFFKKDCLVKIQEQQNYTLL
ncbi:AAA family ATPase [uncultured Clostridium sp.]|uniref:AAA family ATPase n=1 Tax=uncultured Clostridium sp. TaxID=59620 RepID=UPI0025EC101E|nr:AAA family ATPase [uncultured Clostridium sp.]